MDYSIGISHITAISCMVYIDNDGAAGGPQNLTVYESDGTTVVKSISASDPGWVMSEITVNGLAPNTTYILKLDDDPTVTATFTTLSDSPKVATESMWADLASRIKAKSDVNITMTTTDPGEGSALAENNYIGVYGGDPIIMDYSTSEVNTGMKWIDGSVIYKKTINFGSLPNNTSKQVAHNIVSLDRIIKIDGIMNDSSDTHFWTIPYVSVNNIEVFSGNIQITTTLDLTSYTAYITLYYTKSS